MSAEGGVRSSSRMTRVGVLLLALGVLELVVACCSLIGTSMLLADTRAAMAGRYRGLCAKGVIVPEKLPDTLVQGPRDDPYAGLNYLLDIGLQLELRWCHMLSGALGVSGILLIVLAVVGREQPHRQPTPVEAKPGN